MSLVFSNSQVPLRLDGDGVVRVGQTPITLDSIVLAYQRGATPEQIAEDYQAISLADAYAIIGYYLREREQVDDYLARQREADQVHLEMLPQPDETTCGPTCLHALYRYFGDNIPLVKVISECGRLEEGGTLAAYLGRHALDRGYQAVMYTYNLRVFDPSWFPADRFKLEQKLLAQMEAKDIPKLHVASRAYIEFLRRGGQIKMEDLTRQLLRGFLNQGVPVMAGLSSTYLYQEAREHGPSFAPDDVRGLPAGHFVVLCGYDRATKLVRVADPYLPNPYAPRDNYYTVPVDRVICAILLGTLTYDANLLILQPAKKRKGPVREHSHSGK
jgi:uncharacterized protein (DUF433 family)